MDVKNLYLAAYSGIFFDFFLKFIHLTQQGIGYLNIDLFAGRRRKKLVIFSVRLKCFFLFTIHIIMKKLTVAICLQRGVFWRLGKRIDGRKKKKAQEICVSSNCYHKDGLQK